MHSLRFRLPVFLVLFLLSSPLVLRADQVSPSNDSSQASQISPADSQENTTMAQDSDVSPYVTADQNGTQTGSMDPVTMEPIEMYPGGNSGGVLVAQPVSDPGVPEGSVDPAVTPEPSGVVLLATGILCCVVFRMRRESFAPMSL